MASPPSINELIQSRQRYLESGDLNALYGACVQLAHAYFEVRNWQGYRSAMNDRFQISFKLKNPGFAVGTLQQLNKTASPLVFVKDLSNFDNPLPLPKPGDPPAKSADVPELNDGLVFLIESLASVERFLDELGKRDAWNQALAEVYYRLSLETFSQDVARAIDWVNAAITIFEKSGPPEMEANARARMGRIQSESGNYAQAMSYYQDAYKLFLELGSPVADEIRRAIELTTILMKAKAN